jgi:hypothetical protein
LEMLRWYLMRVSLNSSQTILREGAEPSSTTINSKSEKV